VSESRKIAAILASDVVGYSRLAGADEDRILARLRTLRSDVIDPTISVHHGRVVKRTGDGSIVEFRSVVDAVRCAIEVQNAMVERNAGVPPERRIEFRIGIHLGDVVEESDGDLMGDGVNIAARLEGVAERRHLPLRGCLSPSSIAARSGGQRPRREGTQEHRLADAGLFAAGRRSRRGEARDGSEAGGASEAHDGQKIVRRWRHSFWRSPPC
jgi:class 3 adenylate cyclase